jgi:predicted small lipoprotein YifL
MKWLLILLLPVSLAGCVTGQNSALPLALAPSDTAAASCLSYGDTPAYGNCNVPGALSAPQETK